MAWFVVTVAGLLEVVWALGLERTHGFTKPGPTLVVLAAMAGSLLLLARAVRTIPLGTAYAVWVAIGVIGAAAGGVLLRGEPLSAPRVGFLVLLLVALVGLKVTTP